MANSKTIKLFIIDVDGVMANGKFYNINHNVVLKKFQDRDFTAIKRFKSSNVKIVILSGDNWNKKMALKRNLNFYLSRTSKTLEKFDFLKIFKKKYNISPNNMAFVGDDYFDIKISKGVRYSFCVSDAPIDLKKVCYKILKTRGGEGVLSEIYDFCVKKKLINSSSYEKVKKIDSLEITSKQMSK